ncbi:lysophospholipid acyltransferase 2-like protein [Dinothrombium tinctorium]|uniref:Lysophospholipid acyltransferase 2-like protein n=1 Tax=Dinothrombium tinctorium TaxID=1965070 RepID=A0A443QM71_9ACAR|nr:lysophospholipid acyltransferase 2-like protein [Dinothrombium tinctorium]
MSTTTSKSSAYPGSRLFESLGKKVDLPLDQLNFIIAQAIALILAFLFTFLLKHQSVSKTTRHVASLIPGVILGYFCFGYQISNLLVMGMLCYIAMITCKANVVQRVVLFVAMFYLSYLHLLRLIQEYGSYTVDITGPTMIAVQKVTSLAFSLHDGLARPQEQLTNEQRKYSVRKIPSLLEFLSYIFQFQSLMCGPLVYYNDYIEFIEGKNFARHMEGNTTKSKPTAMWAVMRRLSISVFFAIMLLTLTPKFPVDKLADENYLRQTSFFSLMLYLFATTAVARFKYYHAWNLGETICNASGLGFNGFTTDGKPKWDLISGVDIVRFETSLNLREALEAWNKTTQSWLRRIAYERTRRYRTLATYVLSAVWHGFYPGYYMTFLTGALYTQAARTARRCIRPHFQKSTSLAFFYDIITCITTRVMMVYLVFPFVLLEFYASLKVYIRLYFYGHLFSLLAIFVLPKLLPPPPVKGASHKLS